MPGDGRHSPSALPPAKLSPLCLPPSFLCRCACWTTATSAGARPRSLPLLKHSPLPPFLPLQVRLVDDDEEEPDRRVMAVCYGTGSPATTFVMLDPAGNLIDFLHCPQFRWVSNTSQAASLVCG